MITFIVEDGEGKRFAINFTNRETVVGFAKRSQTFTRPIDQVVRVDSATGELVWKR